MTERQLPQPDGTLLKWRDAPVTDRECLCYELHLRALHFTGHQRDSALYGYAAASSCFLDSHRAYMAAINSLHRNSRELGGWNAVSPVYQQLVLMFLYSVIEEGWERTDAAVSCNCGAQREFVLSAIKTVQAAVRFLMGVE